MKPQQWRNTLRKLVTNPSAEVMATIALVLGAVWILAQADPSQLGGALPLFGRH